MTTNTWIAKLPRSAYLGMKNDLLAAPAFASIRRYAGIKDDAVIDDIEEFHVWLGFVEVGVSRVLACSLTDLPDHPYADWFSEDMGAGAAARELYAAMMEEASYFEIGD